MNPNECKVTTQVEVVRKHARTTHANHGVAKREHQREAWASSASMTQDTADRALRELLTIAWPCGAVEYVTQGPDRTLVLVDSAGDRTELDLAEVPKRDWTSLVRASAQIQDRHTSA